MATSILDTINNWVGENSLQVVVTKELIAIMIHIMEEINILIVY